MDGLTHFVMSDGVSEMMALTLLDKEIPRVRVRTGGKEVNGGEVPR